MAKRCPRGFVCTDWTTVLLGMAVIGAVLGAIWWFSRQPSFRRAEVQQPPTQQPPTVVVVSSPQQKLLPDEPVRRIVNPVAGGFRTLPAFEQVGILTGEGGSSSSASPERTILPLYGRELDSRRGKWNYYTRTDGLNPVQVPVRVRNRVCDDDVTGCDEITTNDSLHVPALGRSFTATVYKKSLFR